ncbi:hypothetical protein ACJX0J_025655, partial [Zea mays]
MIFFYANYLSNVDTLTLVRRVREEVFNENFISLLKTKITQRQGIPTILSHDTDWNSIEGANLVLKGRDLHF